MVKEVNCLSCGCVLFRIGPLDEKGEFWGVYNEDYKIFESMHKQIGEKEYYACPQCLKKNWIAGFSEPGKGQRTWVSHITE